MSEAVGDGGAVLTDPWGSWSFADGEARHWRLGGLDLFVRRERDSWLLQHVVKLIDVDAAPAAVLGASIEWQPENSAADVVRHLQVDAGASATLRLAPRLPDRPVVSRPREPFTLRPGQQTTLWVGVALWLAAFGADDETPLIEVPTLPRQQTWFGPDTRTGMLCYASRTRCRTAREDLSTEPWRVVVPLRLDNRAKDAWALDRVALPVELLPILQLPDGGLMAPSLSVVRDRDGDVREVRVTDRLPDGLTGRSLTEARRSEATSFIGRFYTHLF